MRRIVFEGKGINCKTKAQIAFKVSDKMTLAGVEKLMINVRVESMTSAFPKDPSVRTASNRWSKRPVPSGSEHKDEDYIALYKTWCAFNALAKGILKTNPASGNTEGYLSDLGYA